MVLPKWFYRGENDFAVGEIYFAVSENDFVLSEIQ